MLPLVLAAGIALASTPPAVPNSRVWPQGLIEVPVAGGWVDPVGLCFADDGRMFVWEKGGRVWNVENGVKAAQPLIDLGEEVGNWRDFGMLGFALDPDFYTNGYVYLLYVVDYHHLKYFGTPQYNPTANEYFRDTIGRLVRYTAKASDGFHSVDLGSRRVLIGESITTGIPILHQSHGTGSLVFGEDGTLLASCGDGASYAQIDKGGPIGGSSNTGLSEGIIKPKEDVGSYRSQLVDSHSGKVLRVDPATGNGVPSNPHYDASAPRAPRSRVWAMGLRNPFRMMIVPESGSHNPADGKPGRLFIGEVGWNDREELNMCTSRGQNFGWPVYEGMDLQPAYLGQVPANKDAPNPLFGTGGCAQQFFTFENLIVQDTLAALSWPNPCNAAVQIPSSLPRFEHVRPLIDWRHGTSPSRTRTYNGQLAASINLNAPGSPIPGPDFGGNCAVACTFIPDDAYGPLHHDSVVFGDFVNDFLYTLALDHDGTPLEVNQLSAPGETGGLVAAAFDAATDELYFIEYDNVGGAGVKRLVDTTNQPPVAVASAVPSYGPAPLTVQLEGSESYDPEGQELSYLWNFGDGATSTLADPVHVFSKGGAPAGPLLRNVSLKVTDLGGKNATVVIPVSLDNTPPHVVITSPVDGSLYSMTQNTQVPMTALVSDSEFSPAQLACSWQVILHHDEHSHAEPPDPSCSTSATISPVGCDGHTYYYEFTLTVSDPAGLSTSESVFMFPACCGASDPQSVATCAGMPASFTTTPTTSGTFTYQWKKNGNPIPGANASTYAIASVAPGDAGSYLAVVTGSCGTIETKPALLSVKIPTTASAPASAAVCPGSPVSFSTTAGGTGPFIFQWRKNGVPISGAMASTYSIAAASASSAGSYTCSVNGACGTVLSAAATLTVNAPPSVSISSPAQGASFALGASIAFAGSATDPEQGNISSSLVWTSSLQGQIGTGASFARSDLVAGTHTISARAVDSCGSPASAAVTISVVNMNVPPATPGQPSAKKLGNFTVQLTWADLSNNEAGFHVQREQKVGKSWTNATIVGTSAANQPTLTDAPGAGNWRYRVRAFNAFGTSSWSAWRNVKL
jgi:glucose/arabinose dehydrogenase